MVIFYRLIQLFEVKNKSIGAIFLRTYENALSSWVCGSLNDPLSRKHAICSSIILISNGLNLYWFGTKRWVGFVIKSIVTPLTSTIVTLIWGGGVPFVNIIFQSTCHAWNWWRKRQAHLASQLIMSYFEVSSVGLGPGTKMLLMVWVGWFLSYEVIGSMFWVCSMLGIKTTVGWPCWFRLFPWLPWTGHLQTKILILEFRAAKLFVLLVEIRPNQFSSTKVEFIDKICHKSQWIQSESKERWHIFLANSFRLLFRLKSLPVRLMIGCILLSKVVPIFCILNLKSLDFELDLILAKFED